MAGIAAYLLIKNKENQEALKALKIALVAAFGFAMLAPFVTGHHHARQVAQTQPVKFAAQEGIIETSDSVPMILFGLPKEDYPFIQPLITVPGMVGFLTHGFDKKTIKGMDTFEKALLPPCVYDLCFLSSDGNAGHVFYRFKRIGSAVDLVQKMGIAQVVLMAVDSFHTIAGDCL